ncbi:MAG: hypothetical protein JNJ89_12175 [Rubrivivax sp.]|nr:hypothetical protein [Rubrivivax sp.]
MAFQHLGQRHLARRVGAQARPPHLSSARGAVVSVRMQSRLRVDSPLALRALLVAGAGVSVLDSISGAEPLRAGRLVRLLPNWSLPAGGIHAVYPPGPAPSHNARAFVEFYRSAVAEEEALTRRHEGAHKS